MTVAQFATLVGVRASTVHRWEGTGDGELRLDPLHAALLSYLRNQLKNLDPTMKARWVIRLQDAVLTLGTLPALAVLLHGLIPQAPHSPASQRGPVRVTPPVGRPAARRAR